MVTAFQLTSAIGTLVAVAFGLLLFLFWIVSLFLVVTEKISVGAKLLWVVALTFLAPIAIPVYFVRRAQRDTAAAAR